MVTIWTDRSKTAWPFSVLGTMQVCLVAAITLIVVSLPAIQRELELSQPELALLSAAYGLAFGGLLLVGGRLADRFGARRTFVIGVAGFGASSLLGSVAAVHGLLLAARFAQGIGAALAAPAAVVLVARLYPDPARRASAFAVWGTLSVTGAVAGSVVSGLVATAGSWRLMFLLPTVVAATVLAGSRSLPPAAPQVSARLGVADGTLVTAGLVALSYGVLERVPGLVAAAILALTAFLLRQRRAADPLLPIGLVADRRRGVALLAIWLTAAASATGTFVLSLYLQQVQGMSQARTSAAFLPLLLVIAMGPISGRLAARHGPRGVTVAGLLLAATATVLLSRIEVGTPYAGVVLAGLVLFSVGSGLAFAGATVTALAAVPAERSGVAGGLVNTAMEVGPTVGLAALLALATARTDALRHAGHDIPEAITSGYALAFGAMAFAFVVIATAVTLIFRRDLER